MLPKVLKILHQYLAGHDTCQSHNTFHHMFYIIYCGTFLDTRKLFTSWKSSFVYKSTKIYILWESILSFVQELLSFCMIPTQQFLVFITCWMVLYHLFVCKILMLLLLLNFQNLEDISIWIFVCVITGPLGQISRPQTPVNTKTVCPLVGFC